MGISSAQQEGEAPVGLVGTWTFQDGGQFQAECGFPVTLGLDGATVALKPGASAGEVDIDLGCYCRLVLTQDADSLRAELKEPVTCSFYYEYAWIEGAVLDGASAVVDPDTGILTLELTGGPGVLERSSVASTCATFSVSGSLRRSSPVPADCGAEETAVGVLSYDFSGLRSCPFGAGREGLHFDIQGADRVVCLAKSGDRGEGNWALPQARKPEDLACGPRAADVPQNSANLRFCRVDGKHFKPMGADAARADSSYAVLKLGEVCPDGSVEMIETIDNGENETRSAAVGRTGPNQVSNSGVASITTLHFCYFPAAEGHQESMASFPDLGFPYAVLHDFEGLQPSWVTLKRWSYIPADTASSNAFSTPLGKDSPMSKQFQQIIESPRDGTYFEMARVR
jgi:hypothetical protein